MEAGRIALAARKRKGLTQRQLADRTGIAQPMISAIECGQQDPRHSTLERILAASDQELDIVPKAGGGVDRTQFFDPLRMTPTQRLRYGVTAAKNVDRFLRSAKRVR